MAHYTKTLDTHDFVMLRMKNQMQKYEENDEAPMSIEYVGEQTLDENTLENIEGG